MGATVGTRETRLLVSPKVSECYKIKVSLLIRNLPANHESEPRSPINLGGNVIIKVRQF